MALLARFLRGGRQSLGLLRAEVSLRLLELIAPRPALAVDALGTRARGAARAPGGSGHVWFAVPKSRVSRSKKRIKAHGRLGQPKPITHWRVDPETGRPLLRHRLWKWQLPAAEARVRAAKAAAKAEAEAAAAPIAAETSPPTTSS
mmetsp:Transcript_25163/g.75553  ORF Transcript_25163/g.75553 Transcript_25163/m.75553 type:complete len:146 (+) Transcript_25163:32-469(+)